MPEICGAATRSCGSIKVIEPLPDTKVDSDVEVPEAHPVNRKITATANEILFMADYFGGRRCFAGSE